ncbi:class IIb bacteriocin, lactobin A/cerein 7B family [Massilia suwonensis]|uniref:Class IIb bacteriocin, lactobin A/cerein 7B family n=1 Tax=Massilia suwonensis TaxID=648895 RepID=A0ABW0MLB7_9BURK
MNAINSIPRTLGMQELTDDEVLEVSGGHPLIPVAGVAAAVAGIWTAGATVGKAVGKAVANLTKD